MLNSELPVKDKNCAKFSEQDEYRCTKCAFRFFFNENGVCRQISPDCESWGNFGLCTACYPGFVLVGGQCQQEEIILPQQAQFVPFTNPDFCRVRKNNSDGSNKTCKECAFRTVNIDG